MLLADHPFEYLTIKEFQVAGKNGPRPKIPMQEVKEDDAERQTHHNTKKQIGHLRLPEWEMREFQRFLLNLRAKYYLGTSNTFNFCRVINASERGLGVYLPVKLEVGQNLKLECVTSHAVGGGEAEENFVLATGRYQVGVGSPLEISDAEVLLANARGSYINALYNFKVAEAKIKKAMGLIG